MFQPLSPLAVWLTVTSGAIVSRMIESVAFDVMLPAASLYWTQTVLAPSAPVKMKATSSLYGLIALNALTNVAVEQSAAWATR